MRILLRHQRYDNENMEIFELRMHVPNIVSHDLQRSVLYRNAIREVWVYLASTLNPERPSSLPPEEL